MHGAYESEAIRRRTLYEEEREPDGRIERKGKTRLLPG